MLFQNADLEYRFSKRSSYETVPIISIYDRELISWGRTQLYFSKQKQALLKGGPHRVHYPFTSIGGNICDGRFSITLKC